MERFRKKLSTDTSRWVFETHKVFDWIQTWMQNNLRRFFNKFFLGSGVVFYGDQAHLQCTAATPSGGNISLTVEGGMAYTPSGEVIYVPSQITDTGLPLPGNGTTSYLALHHIQEYDSDNAYLVNRMPESFADIQVHVMDGYELLLDSAWPAGETADDSVRIAQIDVDGAGNITVTDMRQPAMFLNMPAAAMSWVEQNYDQIDMNGTQASSFTVGGNEVMINPGPAPNPLNLRIYDIKPVQESRDIAVGDLTLRWGWQNLSGAHDIADPVDTIRVTGVQAGSVALDVGADDLVGQILYCPNFQSPGAFYEITANAATSGGETLITLDSDYNNESMVENGIIVPRAEEIELELIPYIDGAYVPKERMQAKLDGDDFPPEFDFRAPIKRKGAVALYRARIRAKLGLTGYSNWVDIQSGSYDPDHGAGGQAEVSYNVPFRMELPNLEATGSLTLTTTSAGFLIDIGGWEEVGDPEKTYHQFEIVRTRADSVDWSDFSTAIREVVRHRQVDVPTSERDDWAVGVRPLQNTQVVGTAVEGKVVSGAMGVTPSDIKLVDEIVDVRSFSGSYTYLQTLNGYFTGYEIEIDTTTLRTPAGGTEVPVATMVMDHIRQNRARMLLSNGDSYWIDDEALYYDGVTTIRLVLSDRTPDPSLVNGTFEIGTTPAGRRVKKIYNIPADYYAVGAAFDSDFIKGAAVDDPAVIRAYQEGLSNQADLFPVYESDAQYEFSADFGILQANGARVVTIDLYDPSASPNNTANVRGRFQLWVRPKGQFGTTTYEQ